jgi:hypothetical protein
VPRGRGLGFSLLWKKTRHNCLGNNLGKQIFDLRSLSFNLNFVLWKNKHKTFVSNADLLPIVRKQLVFLSTNVLLIIFHVRRELV